MFIHVLLFLCHHKAEQRERERERERDRETERERERQKLRNNALKQILLF
jgi:hypothetical protein